MGGDVRRVRAGRAVLDEHAGARPAARWCPRCGDEAGDPAGEGAHPACRAALALEPPRFCRYCRRRMKVQVLPVGWTAVCVEHGEVRG